MRTNAQSSLERACTPTFDLSSPDISKSGSLTFNRSTNQRTKLTLVNQDQFQSFTNSEISVTGSNLNERGLSPSVLRNEFIDRNKQYILPDDLDDSIENKICCDGSLGYLNDMAEHPSRHTRYCCYYHRFPYPCWVYYIKPVAQISFALFCAIMIPILFKHFSSTLKSLNTLTVYVHELKSDIEALSLGLKHTVDTQQRNEHHIEEISEILERLTHITHNVSMQRSKIDLEKDNLLNTLVKKTESFKHVVKREISDYDADKTARSDFALESAGGQILSVLNTRPYIIETGSYLSSGWNYLMRSLCSASESARPILQGIKDVKNPDGHFFGEFTYNKDGPAVQYYDVQYPSTTFFDIVQLKTHSNWGNPHYTCVYRLRVHGMLNKMLSQEKFQSSSNSFENYNI